MAMATEKETDDEQSSRVEAKEGLKHTRGSVLIYKDIHLSNTIQSAYFRTEGKDLLARFARVIIQRDQRRGDED
jgi:hypothetical protein